MQLYSASVKAYNPQNAKIIPTILSPKRTIVSFYPLMIDILEFQEDNAVLSGNLMFGTQIANSRML